MFSACFILLVIVPLVTFVLFEYFFQLFIIMDNRSRSR